MTTENQAINFEDHFSKHSEQYVQFRPHYPDEIYAYLASLTPGHSLAWDCGTGNGQAAVGLATYFDRIHATDASAEQIAHARPHEKVEYRVEPAEHISLPDSSADLVTVAVAIHWFNFDEFYREVKRVLKPGGILAAWTYSFSEISSEIDPWVRHYHGNILSGHWPERIRYLDEEYKTIPFPFEEVVPPSFAIEVNWDLIQFAGFLDSWSAAQRYRAEKGHHPLELVWEQLLAAWGDEHRSRLIRWSLHFRIGRSK